MPDIGQRMITAVDCTIVRFNKRQIIPYMFVLYSQTEPYFSKVKSLCSGSTRQRISRENLSNLTITLPQVLEQQKIADCLSSIDKLITVQTQKLKVLKEHKKGLMQQLFPAVNEAQG
jgi:type I restriction enzyme S subunit